MGNKVAFIVAGSLSCQFKKHFFIKRLSLYILRYSDNKMIVQFVAFHTSMKILKKQIKLFFNSVI